VATLIIHILAVDNKASCKDFYRYSNKLLCLIARLTAQQSTYLLLPVAQGALLLTVRINMMTMAPQSPPQAMLTAMACFTEDDIGFSCAFFIVWVGIFSTNNQIIQAIAVNIACGGD
jgi:hypothetical protein